MHYRHHHHKRVHRTAVLQCRARTVTYFYIPAPKSYATVQTIYWFQRCIKKTAQRLPPENVSHAPTFFSSYSHGYGTLTKQPNTTDNYDYRPIIRACHKFCLVSKRLLKQIPPTPEDCWSNVNILTKMLDATNPCCHQVKLNTQQYKLTNQWTENTQGRWSTLHNKYQLSVMNPCGMLHHGKRAANKGGRSV